MGTGTCTQMSTHTHTPHSHTCTKKEMAKVSDKDLSYVLEVLAHFVLELLARELDRLSLEVWA